MAAAAGVSAVARFAEQLHQHAGAVAAAVIALSAALAAYVMVKFYGVIFLGQRREKVLEHAHDAGYRERAGMAWLALLCVLLGLAPVFVVQHLDLVTRMLIGHGLAMRRRLAVPRPVDTTAPLQSAVFSAGGAGVMLLTVLLVRRLYHGRSRRSAAWIAAFRAERAHAGYRRGFGQPYGVSSNRSSR